MVRFHWYSEDGCDCQVHPGSLAQDAASGVLHATAELKLPGQRAPVEATFTMPDTFMTESKEVGIFLTLGDKTLPGNSKFVAEFGTSLAKQGHIVVRQFVKTEDPKKQQEIQKTINACIASPYAQHAKKWVLVGVGPGCQIASSISHLFKETLEAFIFVASPLIMSAVMDTDSLMKTPHQTSDIPMLFLHPSASEACPKEVIIERLNTTTAHMIRYMNIPEVDHNFRTSKGKNAVHIVSAFVVSAVFEFLNVLKKGDLENCLIPSLAHDNINAVLCESEDPMDISQN